MASMDGDNTERTGLTKVSLPCDRGCFLASQSSLPRFYLLAETPLSIDPVATAKRDTEQLSLLSTAHSLSVSSWVWDSPWS